MDFRFGRRSIRAIAAGATVIAMSTSLLTAFQQQAVAATPGCSDGSRDTAALLAAQNNFFVPAGAQGTAWVWNRKIELRYNNNIRCGWGLISQGNNGDEVWVERSNTSSQLGRRSIQNGNGSTYTGTYNDAYLSMRVCGKAGDRVEVACTAWF